MYHTGKMMKVKEAGLKLVLTSVVIGQGVMVLNKRGEIQIRYKKNGFCNWGGKALAQVAQKSCGFFIPRSVQSQIGWGLENCGPVGGVPAHGRGLEVDEF